MKFLKSKTNRGFALVQFRDNNDELCDIQRSSAATADKIWLGTNSANPRIMASQTEQGGTGWVDYPISKDVLLSHRMHLTRRQSISLALKLLNFGLFNELR